jgi:hypothetical protein
MTYTLGRALRSEHYTKEESCPHSTIQSNQKAIVRPSVGGG